MNGIDMSQVLAKNASLDLTLKADSGYRAKSTGYRISPIQWAAIIGICEGTIDAAAIMSEHLARGEQS